MTEQHTNPTRSGQPTPRHPGDSELVAPFEREVIPLRELLYRHALRLCRNHLDADGEIIWVKYHFISDQGIQCLTQEEAHRLVSVDGDYHTRDLHEAIKRGDYPSWTLKMQIMSFEDARTGPRV
jgi:hypothetical protein